ncbi:ABC transporter ATP-binding protein [Corynebacterium yonathiae]|uniref:ABC transporter ATP-binding protein n=1 Tax=Corynebacterium yonathiae TaxID=2913504 RepID=A0ABU8Y0T1_9CORY|nr:ABC transporter ATP-binding protein [uncultured Corynebacterium sp.]
MLKAENLTKRYGRRTVLKRVTVSIAPGEFVAIMGPSGSGKTTLLNLLSGLDKPTSGQVNAPGRKQRAFVFQDYNLLESLNAQRNATLTARFSGRRPSRSRVAEVFDSLDLAGLERRLPAQLSGGQQQRVAVARALLAQAPYIFADEPTGALDDATASTVFSHLRAAAREGASVIMVTHSHLAAEAADRVISLEEVAHAGVA